MFTDMSFEEWLKLVKQKFAEAGLQLPEEEEMLELAFMECRADNKSIDQFVADTAREQNPGS